MPGDVVEDQAARPSRARRSALDRWRPGAHGCDNEVRRPTGRRTTRRGPGGTAPRAGEATIMRRGWIWWPTIALLILACGPTGGAPAPGGTTSGTQPGAASAPSGSSDQATSPAAVPTPE